MKYIKPTYKNEMLEASDIILASVDMGAGITFTEKADGSAQVGASALDILGLR